MLKKIKGIEKNSSNEDMTAPCLKWGKKIQNDNLSLSEKKIVNQLVLRDDEQQEELQAKKWTLFKENRDEDFNNYLEKNKLVNNVRFQMYTIYLVFLFIMFFAAIYVGGIDWEYWEKALAKISNEQFAKYYYDFDTVRIDLLRFNVKIFFVAMLSLLGLAGYLEIKEIKSKKEKAFESYTKELKEMYSKFNLLTMFMEKHNFKDEECYVFMSLLRNDFNKTREDSGETPLSLFEMICEYEFDLADMENAEFIKRKQEADKYFIAIRDEVYQNVSDKGTVLGDKSGEDDISYIELEDEQSIDKMIDTLMKRKEALKENNRVNNFS